jgi:hypothetical protein
MRHVSQEISSGELVVEAAPLPQQRAAGTIELWGREVGPVAVAATAGAAAGIAAVAVARTAVRRERRPPRRGLFRRRERVVARRSFLVDVHVLGR